MNTYKIVQVANYERGDISGYKQDYEVYDNNGKWCGSWLGAPNGKIVEAERHVVVREILVTSEFPIGAIFKFKKWEAQGLPEEFLMG